MKLAKYLICILFCFYGFTQAKAEAVINLKIKKNHRYLHWDSLGLYQVYYFSKIPLAKVDFEPGDTVIKLVIDEPLFCRLLLTQSQPVDLILIPDDTVNLIYDYEIIGDPSDKFYPKRTIYFDEGSINWLNDSLNKLCVYQDGSIHSEPKRNWRWRQRPRYTGWRYSGPNEPVEVQRHKIDSSINAIDNALANLRLRFAGNRLAQQIIDWQEYELKLSPYGEYKNVDKSKLIQSFIASVDTIPNYYVFKEIKKLTYNYKEDFLLSREKEDKLSKYVPLLKKGELDELLNTQQYEDENLEIMSKLILIHYLAFDWFYWDFDDLEDRLKQRKGKGNDFVDRLYDAVQVSINDERKLRQFDVDSFVFRTLHGDTFRMSEVTLPYIYVFEADLWHPAKEIHKFGKLYERYGDSVLFVCVVDYRDDEKMPRSIRKIDPQPNWVTVYSSPIDSVERASQWRHTIWMNEFVDKQFDNWNEFFVDFVIRVSKNYIVTKDGYLYVPQCGRRSFRYYPEDVFEEVFGKPN